MSIKNIGIIGSGIMGSGIAQVSAAAGYQIVIQDISKDALEKYQKQFGKVCQQRQN
jgi:3-hydroxybutyryl-CoA dehydrogenase